MRLQGALNVAVLEQSFNEIIRRHEALRTTFATVHGQLVQIIAPTWHMALTVRDLRAFPEVERAGIAISSVGHGLECRPPTLKKSLSSWRN